MIDCLKEIPTIGWVTILIISVLLLVIISIIIYFVFYTLFKKNIKTKFFEINEIPKQQKDLYIAEGKDQLDNQSQVAKQMLKALRVKLYTIGKDLLKIDNQKDLYILELITYRITDRLNYEIRNDLTRNHIINKSDDELVEYTKAKAKGYKMLVQDRLFLCNPKLSRYDLPSIMTQVSDDDFIKIFKDIYFAARSIVGVAKGEKK